MVDAAAVVVVALVVVVVALVVVEPVVEDFWGIFLLFLTQAAAEDIPLSFGAGAALFLFLLDFSRRSLRELFILEEERGDGAVLVRCCGDGDVRWSGRWSLAEKICSMKNKGRVIPSFKFQKSSKRKSQHFFCKQNI